MRIVTTASAAAIALASSACTATPAPVAAPAALPLPAIQAPAETAAAFLEAFNALDPARFDAFFADEVTMFFPEGPFPKGRVEGKPAVTAAFHRFFDMAKQRGATRLNIRPQKLHAQDHGAFAIVSFELGGSDNLGRRSLVLRRDGSDWRIVHFHASAVELPKPKE